MAAVGLIPKPEVKVAATLGPFIKNYVTGRVDVKPATKEVWRQGEMGLVEFFGRLPLCRRRGKPDGRRHRNGHSGRENTAQWARAGNRRDSQKESQAFTSASFERVDARRNSFLHNDLADGKGFEPPVDFRPQRFSRPPP